MKKTTIVIIGKPNVGKSTLFNRLIGKTKSIVSPIEGITAIGSLLSDSNKNQGLLGLSQK